MSDHGKHMVGDQLCEAARCAISYGVSAKDVRLMLVEAWEAEMAQKLKADKRTLWESIP